MYQARTSLVQRGGVGPWSQRETKYLYSFLFLRFLQLNKTHIHHCLTLPRFHNMPDHTSTNASNTSTTTPVSTRLKNKFRPSLTGLIELIRYPSRTAKSAQQSRNQTPSVSKQSTNLSQQAGTKQPGGPESEPDPWAPGRKGQYSTPHYQGEIRGSNAKSQPDQTVSTVGNPSLDSDPDAITPVARK